MDIKILKPGDKVLVECTVQAVFANSKMVMVTTRDCTEGFDAYIDEIQEPLEQEPQSFEWCDTCKEYDQEKHCCHRWTKVIRNTVEEMKLGYERDVLDKVRAEIERLQKMCNEDDLNLMAQHHAFGMVLDIFDKYKAETEVEDGKDIL